MKEKHTLKVNTKENTYFLDDMDIGYGTLELSFIVNEENRPPKVKIIMEANIEIDGVFVSDKCKC